MDDVKEFEVFGFEEEIYLSNSITSLVYSWDIILVKQISIRGNLESIMFLKSI